MIRITHPQDFWSGLLFVAFGAAGVYLGREYAFGTLTRMGPGFLPAVLSWLLVAVGAFVAARSVVLRGAPIERSAYRPQILIVAAIVLFAVLIERVGLVPTVFVVAMTASFASSEFRLKDALLLSAGAAIATDVIFIRLLSVPMNSVAWNF